MELSAPAIPVWDRYGHWPRALAQAALALLIVLLALAAWSPGMPVAPREAPLTTSPVQDVPSAGKPAVAIAEDDGRDNDLRLYQLIAERVKRGESYYAVATQLQRANGYPVAPGLTVRLPTLAYLHAWLGKSAMTMMAWAVIGAALLAVWRRFASEPGGQDFRLFGVALFFFGLGNATHPPLLQLHEVWSGLLLALAFGLHRPATGPGIDHGQKSRWGAALIAGAAALAVRELALPFVLLMAASAGWRRDWREAAAWSAVAAGFLALLAWHVSLAEAQLRPGDPASPPWIALSWLPGLLHKVIHSSPLHLLPTMLAGPVVILALFGWSGWNSAMGRFASLLTLGYGAAFMIAGRDNNFYWAVMMTPILFMGLAMAPFATRSLWRRAKGHHA